MGWRLEAPKSGSCQVQTWSRLKPAYKQPPAAIFIFLSVILSIVMEKGTIIEEGIHEELLMKKNGHYKNLFDKQFNLKLS